MTDSLGLIYTAFKAAPPDQKYKVCRRIKATIQKNPALGSERGHPVFLEAISWHLDNLKAERQTLQDFFNKRTDAILDGFDDMPPDSIRGFRYLNEKIAERIQEINKLIAGYETELEQRKLNQ